MSTDMPLTCVTEEQTQALILGEGQTSLGDYGSRTKEHQFLEQDGTGQHEANKIQQVLGRKGNGNCKANANPMEQRLCIATWIPTCK